MVQVISKYLFILTGYFFFCRFSFTLNEYISNLKDNVLKWAESLKESFHNSYASDCKKPWDSFNKVINKYSVERKELMRWQTISVLLLIFNGYMLSQFMNAMSPALAISLTPFWFPFQITYGIIASIVIVIIEIGCGSLYCYYYFEYEENPNLGIYSFLKMVMIGIMIMVGIVECIFWARVSVVFKIGEELGLSNTNILSNFIDYFLAFLGAGITLFEFGVGYMLFKFRKYAPPKSVLGQRTKYLVSSILYFTIYFIPNIICRILYGLLILAIWVVKLIVLPGNFIYENITEKFS